MAAHRIKRASQIVRAAAPLSWRDGEQGTESTITVSGLSWIPGVSTDQDLAIVLVGLKKGKEVNALLSGENLVQGMGVSIHVANDGGKLEIKLPIGESEKLLEITDQLKLGRQKAENFIASALTKATISEGGVCWIDRLDGMIKRRCLSWIVDPRSFFDFTQSRVDQTFTVSALGKLGPVNILMEIPKPELMELRKVADELMREETEEGITHPLKAILVGPMDENWKSKAGFGTGEKTNSKFEEFIKTRLALQVRKDGENLPEIKIMRSNKNAIHGVAICYKNSHEVREALAEFKNHRPACIEGGWRTRGRGSVRITAKTNATLTSLPIEMCRLVTRRRLEERSEEEAHRQSNSLQQVIEEISEADRLKEEGKATELAHAGQTLPKTESN